MHHVMVIYKLQINPLSILQTVYIPLSLNESIIKIFSGYLHDFGRNPVWNTMFKRPLYSE